MCCCAFKTEIYNAYKTWIESLNNPQEQDLWKSELKKMNRYEGGKGKRTLLEEAQHEILEMMNKKLDLKKEQVEYWLQVSGLIPTDSTDLTTYNFIDKEKLDKCTFLWSSAEDANYFKDWPVGFMDVRLIPRESSRESGGPQLGLFWYTEKIPDHAWLSESAKERGVYKYTNPVNKEVREIKPASISLLRLRNTLSNFGMSAN